MARSISNLKPGDVVRVGYKTWVPDENSTFVRFNEGKTEAHFIDPDGSKWYAYKSNGRWCVGTSSDGAKLYDKI